MIGRRSFTALAAARAIAAAGPGRIRVGCQTRSYRDPPKEPGALYAVLDMAAAHYEVFETNHIILNGIADPANARREIGRRLPLIGLHLGLRWNTPDVRDKSLADIARVAKGVRALGGAHLMLRWE